MPAYLIVDIEITHPERYAEYIKQAPASIARYGGRYLARAGRTQSLEGTWTPKRLVVLEFPTYERALEWWGCEDYSGPKALRQSASITNMVLIEGVDGQP
ncbi:MAG TPA: DUF1330 domain-containing protein [Candidatus Polarisedimenticolia bacterium]|nr:DUF1330 domain-containing protein [Candidatus Polarisedimenticolia bacterium]